MKYVVGLRNHCLYLKEHREYRRGGVYGGYTIITCIIVEDPLEATLFSEESSARDFRRKVVDKDVGYIFKLHGGRTEFVPEPTPPKVRRWYKLWL